MKLRPLESASDFENAAGWLAREENYRWLDIGNGQQAMSPTALKIMSQRNNHVLRLYTGRDDDGPIGIVALENINRRFGTATFWSVAGDKAFRARGYASMATDLMLEYAFEELGLHAVSTWIVDGNPSARLAEKLGFRYCGRQREAHEMDGELRDRLLYDILAREHREQLARPERRGPAAEA